MDVAVEGHLFPSAHQHAVGLDGDDGAVKTCREGVTVTPRSPAHPPPAHSDPCRNARRTGSRTGVSHDSDHERGFLLDAACTHTADVFARVGGGELDQPQVGVGDLWEEKSAAELGFLISAFPTSPSPLLCQRDRLLSPQGGQSHPHLVTRRQLALSPIPGERGLGLAWSNARQIQGPSFHGGGGGRLNPQSWDRPRRCRKGGENASNELGLSCGRSGWPKRAGERGAE